MDEKAAAKRCKNVSGGRWPAIYLCESLVTEYLLNLPLGY